MCCSEQQSVKLYMNCMGNVAHKTCMLVRQQCTPTGSAVRVRSDCVCHHAVSCHCKQYICTSQRSTEGVCSLRLPYADSRVSNSAHAVCCADYCCCCAHVYVLAAVCVQVLQVLQVLTSDPANEVWIISGRSQQELGGWFQSVVRRRKGG